MRQSWGTIRERLGLSPTPPSPSTTASTATTGGSVSAAQQQQQVTDTRELMLDEMARAFRIGLGLNTGATGGAPPPVGSVTPFSGVASLSPIGVAGVGGSTGSVGVVGNAGVGGINGMEGGEMGGGGGEGTQHGTALPAEGSLDRFLVDLQADLRAAFTQSEEGEGEEEGEREGEGGVDVTTAVPTSSANSIHTSMSRLPSALMGVGSGNAPSALVLGSPDVNTPSPPTLPVTSSTSTSPQTSSTSTAPPTLPTSTSTGPPTSPTSRSATSAPPPTSESGEAVMVTAVDSGEAEAQQTTTTTMNTSTPTTAGSGRINANGRINWWRLYRFPAINAPRIVPGPLASSTLTTSPSSSAASSTSPPTGVPPSTVSTTTPTPTGTQGATPFLPNFLPPPPGQTVVPVIVVGLQSVNNGWAEDHTHSDQQAHRHPYAQPQTQQDLSQSRVGLQQAPSVGVIGSERRRMRTVVVEEVGGVTDMEYEEDDNGEYIDVDSEDEYEEGIMDEYLSPEDMDLGAMSRTATTTTPSRSRRHHAQRGGSVLRALRRGAAVAARRRGAAGLGAVPARRRGRGAEAGVVYPLPPPSTSEYRNSIGSIGRQAGVGGVGGHGGMGHGGATQGMGVPGMHMHMNPNVPGSRTFLIYVIGGYYPPDHTIVTEDLENFESFDALL